MKRKQPVVIQRNSAVHSEEEVDHQSEFQDHVGRELLGQVLIAFPAVLKVVDVEFRRTNKFTSLAQVSFEYSYCVVQGEAQGY